MLTFETPEPISLEVKVAIANVHLTAGERADTTVDVLPTDPARAADVTAAAEMRVEYGNGCLSIRYPRPWRQYGWWGKRSSVDLWVELPAGSRVNCDAGMAAFESLGRLGECRVASGGGSIRVAEAGPAQLETGAGDVVADRILDGVSVRTGTGAVRVGSAHGTVTVRNANGETEVGEATGKVEVHAANGRILIGHAQDAVLARTAHGDVEIGQVEAGTVSVRTAMGKVEIGVRAGVVAWLDIATKFGHVRNDLDTAEQPEGAQPTVQVHVDTDYGDISIHRATSDDRRDVTA